MGTTLTGTTPQDTYDSLIKVTDNGPISGTAKFLSDGLGNDSALALSTTLVGVGTASPAQKLHISSSETTAYAASSASLIQPDGGSNLLIQNTGAAGFASLRFASLNTSNAVGYFGFNNTTANVGGAFIFGQRTGAASYAEQMRITDTGNVGIGNSIPSSFLSNGNQLVVGSGAAAQGITIYSSTAGQGNLFFADGTAGDAAFRGFLRYDHALDAMQFYTAGGNERMRITSTGVVELTQGQIKFPATQVASADSNTLDDYEEGTWTMGVSFGGASVGVTTSENTGTYTKIGRQVTVNGYLGLTSKGSSTGSARITGLPFTIANSTANYSAPSFWFNNVSFANQFQGLSQINTTNVELYEITEAGVLTFLADADIANGSAIAISLTYFV